MPRLIARLATACLLLAFLFSVYLAAPARAQDTEIPTVTRTFAIENARVVQAPGQVLDRATVIVRDGLITDIGTDVSIPFDAERIAGDSLTVYAGFIDGLSHAGIDMPNESDDDEDPGADEEGGDTDPSYARSGIQPDRSARTFLDPSASSVEDLRELGFTTAHIVPKGRMLPGTGAIVQLAGTDADAMVLMPDKAMFAQYKGARGSYPNSVYPSTEMAVIAAMRDLYRETARRVDLEEAYADDKRGRQRPPTDAVHDALKPVVAGNMPMVVYTETPLDIHRTLTLQSELGFQPILAGLSGAFDAVDALQSAAAPLLLTLDLPEPPDDEEDEITAADSALTDTARAVTPEEPGSFFARDYRTRSFADIEGETRNLKARQAIEQEKYYSTAATLHNAGLSFGFASKGAKTGKIRENLRTMIENGLPEDVALAALTTNAAQVLGISDQLGTVEEGKIANLVLTTGPYFEEDSDVRYVFVDGQKFEYEAGGSTGEITGEVAAITGTWAYDIESPQGQLSGTIEIEGSEGDVSGRMSSPVDEKTYILDDISFDGESLSFAVDTGEAGVATVSVDISGDSFEGNVSVGGQGSFPITGNRTSSPDRR